MILPRNIPPSIIVMARRTSMSPPPDECHFYGPPGLWPPEADRALVSCTFTWDKPRAEWLAEQWRTVCPDVLLGGPAYGDPGGQFEPGKFLREGVTITTRGCPGCSHPCLVPTREGGLRCLNVQPGYNVLDNNLLAAPRAHIEQVLSMLAREHRPAIFSGGLEARRLEDWFIARLTKMRVGEIWLAYDAADQLDALREGIHKLREAGFSSRKIRCYVLVGQQGDTLARAESRLLNTWQMGAWPFAMLWRGAKAQRRREPEWAALVRTWTRPALFKRLAQPVTEELFR